MWRIAVICMFVVVVILDCIEKTEANALCQPCLIAEECDREPDDCIFGVVRNYCGRKVCAKGPGKRCGGPSSVNGECGEGMHCRCDRCTGCSLRTLDCYLPEAIWTSCQNLWRANVEDALRRLEHDKPNHL